MKTYIGKLTSSFLCGVACLLLCGCGDFLEIEPKTFISEDNFWNEKADVDQMVAGVYVKMQDNAFIERCIMWGETRSDNIAEGLNASGQLDIYRTLKENLLSTNAYTKWDAFYSVINQCNTIIEMAPVVSEKDPVYTESDVRATQAEMKAVRALCYFYLVRAFKDVPYDTSANMSEDDAEPIAATSGDEIVRSLISDLEGCASDALKAYPKDQGSTYNTTRNRITQAAIYSILTDLCLWDAQYDKAVDYAQKVIDSKYDEYMEDYSSGSGVAGSSSSPHIFQNENDTYHPNGFPLYRCYEGSSKASFGNDFNQIFGGDQCSFESIFELAFTYDGTSSNFLGNSAFGTLYGNGVSGGNSGQGYLAVNSEIVSDLANSTSGSLFDHNRDVRYWEYMNPEDKETYSSGYTNKGVAKSVTISGPYSTTFPNYSVSDPTVDLYENRNFIFYRLTDVMLMQAEALIEKSAEVTEIVDEENNTVTAGTLSEDLQKAFYLIWAVNYRSIMDNESSNELKLSSYTTKSQLEDLVLKERRRELMFEGKRWFDLIRQCHHAGNTTDYVRSHVGAKGSSGGSTTLFTNYEALYWPYNKDELKNNSLLSQKPYYGNDDDESSFSSTK